MPICLFSAVLVAPTKAANHQVWHSIERHTPIWQLRYLELVNRQIGRCICQERQKRRYRNDCTRSCTELLEWESYLLNPSFGGVRLGVLTVFDRRFFLRVFPVSRQWHRFYKQTKCVASLRKFLCCTLSQSQS